APEHKKRIQNYAKKLDADMDVVVVGQTITRDLIYKGQIYDKSQISADLSDGDMQYKINTPEGVVKVPIEEIKHTRTLNPIYNAYIFASHNKENMNYAPYKKQFDFTGNTENVLIRPDNRVEEDSIVY
ncbi:hypothetical protein IKA92_05610, partial [bacterium]|nr:hypothetical protein [bacterium]